MDNNLPTKILERLESYVTGVIDGSITTNVRVKAACKRHVMFRQNKDYYFDSDIVDRFVEFAEKLTVSDGHHLTGNNLVLVDWQVYTLGSMLGWKYVDNNGVLHRQGWVECSRGAGKTAMLAVIAIFMAIELKGCDVILLSNKIEQADICLDSCKRFLDECHMVPFVIKHRSVDIGKSTIKTYSASLHSLDGLRARLYIIDEGAEAKKDVFSKIISALPKSRDSQMISITTPCSAEVGLESIYYVNKRVAEDCLKDHSKLHHIFGYLAGIDAGDDIADETCWIKGNPSLGHLVTIKDYRRAFESYKSQSKEHDWERFQLCRYASDDTGWIPPKDIKEVTTNLDIMDFVGEECYIGIDFSKSFDITSMCVSLRRLL